MKQLSKPIVLSGICAAAGLLCMCVRQWLFTSGVDGKGLLDPSHPGNLLSWLIGAAVAAVLLLSARERCRCRFVPSRLQAAGLLSTALGYGAAARTLLQDITLPLAALAGGLGVLSALCSLWILVDLCRKKRTHPLVYCPCVVFFMLFLVCRYQVWSGEPELQRCVFPLAAVILMLTTTYRRAALALERRDWKLYLQLSRGAVFLLLASIPESSYALSLGLWALGLLLDGCAPVRPRTENV